MTNKDKVFTALGNAELCDDCLSISSGVSPRNAVNGICRTLFKESKIHRHFSKCNHCGKNKYVNHLLEGTPAKITVSIAEQSDLIKLKPWFWEGNVQSKVVTFLVQNNYSIQSVANTASRESGKDIVAVASNGTELWVSVKGYPETSSNTQARHWFCHAIFDLILYRGENPQVNLALAFPDGYKTYANLLPRVMWLKQLMNFRIFWVSENGNIRLE